MRKKHLFMRIINISRSLSITHKGVMAILLLTSEMIILNSKKYLYIWEIA